MESRRPSRWRWVSCPNSVRRKPIRMKARERAGLAPATEGAGAAGKGVVVTGVDPNGPAAEHGFQTGDLILDVAGKAVSNPADVRNALTELRKEGKHTVLMRVKSADATRFVAMPLNRG